MNSTALGFVIDDPLLRKYRVAFGPKVSDDPKRIDFLRLTGCLFERWKGIRLADRQPTDEDLKAILGRHRDAAAKRADLSDVRSRDIGKLAEVVDPEMKEACRFDFRLFCLTYFPEAFADPFSDDHEQVIEKIEETILSGGNFALAMPRGSGKTTLCQVAVIWAIFYGHRRFVCLIGATANKARELMDELKLIIETNEKLADDFPEIVQAFVHLGGISKRCHGQRHCGKPTHFRYEVKKIVFPTIEGSPASGSVLTTAGLTGGEIRGQKHTTADGVVLRPDLALLDDPQTNRTAKSKTMNQEREKLLGGAVLGMAGPGKKIAALMTCTVIEAGDMADRILSREVHPEWHGLRFKLLYGQPTDLKLWDKYNELREASEREIESIEPATKFYVKHRKAMDVGARAAWESRYYRDEGEASAIQHAMNLFYRDPIAFAAEYQNEPLQEKASDVEIPDEKVIAQKIHGYKRNVPPVEAHRLTAGIDCQQRLLYWVVIAWKDAFEGFIVDYGTWPKIDRNYYLYEQTKESYRQIVDQKTGKKTTLPLEAAIFRAVTECVDWLATRKFFTDERTELSIDRIVPDYGDQGKHILEACRQSPHRRLLFPSIGRAPRPGAKSIMEWKLPKGFRRGDHYLVGPRAATGGKLLTITADANYWKSFFQERLRTALNAKGSISLFGPQREVNHRMIAEQFAAERPQRIEADGVAHVKWNRLPARDNHFLDAAVNACIAEATLGGRLALSADSPTLARKSDSPAKRRRQRVYYPD